MGNHASSGEILKDVTPSHARSWVSAVWCLARSLLLKHMWPVLEQVSTPNNTAELWGIKKSAVPQSDRACSARLACVHVRWLSARRWCVLWVRAVTDQSMSVWLWQAGTSCWKFSYASVSHCHIFSHGAALRAPGLVLQLHWQYTSHPRVNTSNLATRCIDMVESQHRQRDFSWWTHTCATSPCRGITRWSTPCLVVFVPWPLSLSFSTVLQQCTCVQPRKDRCDDAFFVIFCPRVTCHASLPLLQCSSVCKSRVFTVSVEDDNFWKPCPWEMPSFLRCQVRRGASYAKNRIGKHCDVVPVRGGLF